MLAIFDGRVAKHPECMKRPHPNAVSALKDDFLVNLFKSTYPTSEVVCPDDSSTFAYSLDNTSDLPRFNYAHEDSVFCMYQGVIKDIETVKQDLKFAEINDEAIVMIRAFQLLRQLGQRMLKKAVEDLSGKCISVFYESTSKLVVLSVGSYYDHPIYWGIDARFNLVISNDERVVEKACGTVEPFVTGKVYACCEGHTGHEAIFLNKQPVFKVSSTEKNNPNPQSIEYIKNMIIQADMDMSQQCAKQWEPPMRNLVKVNIDGVLFKDGMLGIGIIVRNSNGEVEFATTRREKNVLPKVEPVVQAFLEGLYCTEAFKLERCIFESVHLNIEKEKEKLGSRFVDAMLEKFGELVVKKLSEFSVSFVSSSANKAARRLALLAKYENYTIWRNETPECIASVVEDELPLSGCTIC